MELETPRCRLRHPLAEDRQVIVSLFTDPEPRRYMGGAVSEPAGQRCFDAMLRRAEWTWIVVRKEDSAILGMIDIDIFHEDQDVEVSYEFLPAHWGHGYASEAVRRVVVHAMLYLHTRRVVAETQVDNVASRKMLERIGMHLERETEHYGRLQCIYSIEMNNSPPTPNSP